MLGELGNPVQGRLEPGRTTTRLRVVSATTLGPPELSLAKVPRTRTLAEPYDNVTLHVKRFLYVQGEIVTLTLGTFTY
jgi:hypothetical protein